MHICQFLSKREKCAIGAGRVLNKNISGARPNQGMVPGEIFILYWSQFTEHSRIKMCQDLVYY